MFPFKWNKFDLFPSWQYAWIASSIQRHEFWRWRIYKNSRQPHLDEFTYEMKTQGNKLTKRSLVSEIGRVFDSLNFLAPITVF